MTVHWLAMKTKYLNPIYCILCYLWHSKLTLVSCRMAILGSIDVCSTVFEFHCVMKISEIVLHVVWGLMVVLFNPSGAP